MTYQVLRDEQGRVAILEADDWGLSLAEAWQAAMDEARWPETDGAEEPKP